MNGMLLKAKLVGANYHVNLHSSTHPAGDVCLVARELITIWKNYIHPTRPMRSPVSDHNVLYLHAFRAGKAN